MANIAVSFGATEDVSKVAAKASESIAKLEDSLDEAGKAGTDAARGVEEMRGKLIGFPGAAGKAGDAARAYAEQAKTAAKESENFGQRARNLKGQLGDVRGLMLGLAGESGKAAGAIGQLGRAGLSAFATGGPIALGLAGIVAGTAAIIGKIQEVRRLDAQERFLGLDKNTLREITEQLPEIDRAGSLALISVGKEAGLTQADIVRLGQEAQAVAEATGKSFDESATEALKRLGVTADMVREKTRSFFSAAFAKEAGPVSPVFDEAAFDKKIAAKQDVINRLEDAERMRAARVNEHGQTLTWREIQKLDAEIAALTAQKDRLSADTTAMLDAKEETEEFLDAQERARKLAAKAEREEAERESKRRTAEARRQADFESAKRALADWDLLRAHSSNAEGGRLEKERAGLIEKAKAAGEGKAREAEIHAFYNAKITEAEQKATDEKLRQIEDVKAKLRTLYAGADDLALLEARHETEIAEFQRWAAAVKLEAAEVEKALAAINTRQEKETADLYQKRIDKEKAASDKLQKEQEKVKADAQKKTVEMLNVGASWADELAHGFKDAIEKGDAGAAFKSALKIISSMLSTFGGPAGAVGGGVLGILGSFLRAGGPVQQIELPKARTGAIIKDLDADGVLLEGHKGEVMLNAQAVNRHGGQEQVNKANTEGAMLGGGGGGTTFRFEVHALDSEGVQQALRRTVEPAQAARIDLRQGAVLHEKLRQGRAF